MAVRDVCADARRDPDEFADQCVLSHDDGTSRVMLVPVARGADVVAALGWRGPVNYTEDLASLSGVLRSAYAASIRRKEGWSFWWD